MTPTVSVVIPAYNYGTFVERAVDSALHQDHPASALEVIVVDDGSTDDTAARLARYGDAITVISQTNAGLIAAVNAGIAAAGGDYLALLDADDLWTPHRLGRMIAHLECHPEIGLLHGDLQIIDADDRPLGRTQFGQFKEAPARGDVAGRLLKANKVTTSALVVRMSLRHRFFPIPAFSPWADCWIAFRAAEASLIDHLDEPVALYRFHGDNAAIGATGERHAAALGRELPYRRWQLSRVDPAACGWADVAHATRQYATTLVGAREIAPLELLAPFATRDPERARSELAAAERLLAQQRHADALLAGARANVANPGNHDAHPVMQRALAALQSGAAAPIARPADDPEITVLAHGSRALALDDLPDGDDPRDGIVLILDDPGADPGAAHAEAVVAALCATPGAEAACAPGATAVVAARLPRDHEIPGWVTQPARHAQIRLLGRAAIVAADTPPPGPPPPGTAGATAELASRLALLRLVVRATAPAATIVELVDEVQALLDAGVKAPRPDPVALERAAMLRAQADAALRAGEATTALSVAGFAYAEEPRADALTLLTAALAELEAQHAALGHRRRVIIGDGIEMAGGGGALLTAYARTFSADDDVTLVLACGTSAAHADAIAAAARHVGLDAPGAPDVVLTPTPDPGLLSPALAGLVGRTAARRGAVAHLPSAGTADELDALHTAVLDPSRSPAGDRLPRTTCRSISVTS